MLQAMARRGPDRQHLSCEDNVGFGQVLLATTPESLVECQPWRHPDSGCIVVSDSRLDYRPQLLRELGITRRADDVGDGELLHAAWQRWGVDCADRLRGDFAFALWNPRQRELFLARDPMGVRPLAFHHRPGHLFVFASSVDAVLAQGQVPRDLDEGRIADALIGETEGIDPICTFHTAVQRLPPAHWLLLRDGVVSQQRYWRPIGNHRPAGLPQTQAEWVQAQREQLDRAVRLRLRSHRPVGSMLSGGLDSSSVVALASAALESKAGATLPVFSATNTADRDCAETRHIHAVIEHVRCAPTLVDLPEFQHSIDCKTLWKQHPGEPFDTSISLVASLYQAAAAKGVPSLMDGAPADNLFVTGRHAKYLADQGRWQDAWHAAVSQWTLPGVRLPRWHALRVMAGCLLPDGVHALRHYLADARFYRELLQESLIDRQFARRVQLWQRFRRYRRTVGDAHQWHHGDEALSSMAAPYITAGLERYNRVASVFGIEPRLPFADRELIEFNAWVPLALRIRDGHAKWVLRQAMAKDLPAQVAWRRDKSNIGWRFNRAVLAASRSAIPKPSQSCALWLDLPRLQARLGRSTPEDAGEGVLEAFDTLLWAFRSTTGSSLP